MKVKLTKDMIDKLFDEGETCNDPAIGLYRLVILDLDKVAVVNHYPKVNRYTSDYIWKKVLEFDREKHPGCIPGFLWMNKGFGTDDDLGLKDWEVFVDEDKIIYLKEKG